VSGMTNQHALFSSGAESSHFNMDFGHQGTGGIENLQASALGLVLYRPGDAVRTEDHDRIIWHLGQLIDEYRAACAQIIDHMTVMHDFVAHIDRATEDFQRSINDVDRPINTGTKTPWIGEYDVHQCNSAGSTRAIFTLK
jgi:hypothetical protein